MPDKWAARAACRGMRPELFHEYAWNNSGGSRIEPGFSAAVAVCEACPVRAECLAEVLKGGPVAGVFAGLDPKEIERVRNGEIST